MMENVRDYAYFQFDKSVRLAECGCGSFACPKCRKWRASVLRDKLKSAIEAGFGRNGFYMVTLTTCHDFSPADTFHRISASRRVGEVMRWLKLYCNAGDWFSMVEFQGNGYTHWHCLVEMPFLDFHGDKCFVPADVRHIWRFGAVNFLRIKNPEASASYVTKYLSGDEKHPVPTWVYQESTFRFYSTSRRFWSKYLGEKPQVRYQPVLLSDDSECSTRQRKTLGERLEKCGTKTNLFTLSGKFLACVCASLMTVVSYVSEGRVTKQFTETRYGTLKEDYYIDFGTALELQRLDDGQTLCWSDKLSQPSALVRWLRGFENG